MNNNKNIEQLLKPKSKQEIESQFNISNRDKKENSIISILKQKLINEHETIELLDSFFEDEQDRIWDNIIELIYDEGLAPSDKSGNYEEISKEYILDNFNFTWILQYYLLSLTDEELNNLFKFIINDFLIIESNKINESLTDLFKPKPKEDIIRDLSKLSQDELNNTLLKACSKKLTSFIQLLIDAGADVNCKNAHGITPLMRASTYGYKDIVKILIDKGADVNIKNIYGNTALMLASWSGHKDIVELLKKYGAKE